MDALRDGAREAIPGRERLPCLLGVPISLAVAFSRALAVAFSRGVSEALGQNQPVLSHRRMVPPPPTSHASLGLLLHTENSVALVPPSDSDHAPPLS